MEVLTIGHGRRPADELVATLQEAGARTLVDVRRYPGSRRNPQFGQAALAAALREAGIEYRHAVELGGRLSGEPGEERFRAYASRRFAAMRRASRRRSGKTRSPRRCRSQRRA